jgi:hypothetical protein
LVTRKEGELLWPVSSAVGNDGLPLDITAADQSFEELLEVGSTLAQICNDLKLELIEVVE